MKKKLIPKHQKAGKILINEPVSESTYREQSPLSLQEQQFITMKNNMGRVPTQAEQIMQERSRQSALYSDAINTGVIKEAKKDNIKNNFFRDYNNFRYSHPWAKGLSYTPIIGDGMDLISLAGAINNKDYMTAGLGLGMLALPNFIQKPLQKYKLGKTYTHNLIKLLGDNKTKEGLTGFRYSHLEPFEQYLKGLKVKTDKFSNSDLQFLQELRKQNILNNLPDERITTIETTSPNVIYYNLYNKDKIGELQTLIDDKNRQHILSIQGKNNKEKNISRDLYDSALQYNNFYNTKGLISGKRLLSPEQTIHIWDKYYPNKEILENTGWHSYNNGLNVKKSGNPIEDYKGKVVDLKTPSSKIPIKSINIFHPDLINTDKWTLKMFDVNNPNPYYKQGGTIKFNPFNKFKI